MARFSLLPREDRFFVIFEKAAQNLLECAALFRNLFDEFTDVSKKVDQITEFEERGDSMTHEIVQVLNQTFVTPMDREDIYRLAEALDDVLDSIEEAACRLVMFEIQAPTVYSVELAQVIMKCCEEINKAMPYLRHPKDLPSLQDNLLQIHSLENRADAIKKTALTELYNRPGDIIALLKWREIYEHMEAATDRCEDVADVLQGLLVKNA
jgi:hypothetical protein